MDEIQNVLTATNPQKVLNFFLNRPGQELIEREVQKTVKISKSGVNYALRELVKANTLFRNKRGKMYFYSLNYKNPIIKQLKVLKTITYIHPGIKKIKELSSKIILFGSSARGENVTDSDIDLFVISNSKKEGIEKEINKLKCKQAIQLVVRTELKHTELKTKDPVFYEQIQQGIVLWERE